MVDSASTEPLLMLEEIVRYLTPFVKPGLLIWMINYKELMADISCNINQLSPLPTSEWGNPMGEAKRRPLRH